MTPSAPAPASPGPLARGTLSRELILRVTALVALVAIALSALTAVAAHRILERQIDEQLHSKVTLLPDDRDRGGSPREGPGETGGAGQQVGLVLYQERLGRAVILTGSTTPQEVAADAVAQLAALPQGREPVTVRLDGLGAYRVLVSVDRSGLRQATGLPLASMNQTMARLLFTAAALTLAAIAAAFLAASRVVTRSLRPLQRLAGTATQVSQLSLHSGEVALSVRVPPADTDPASEVGRVGLALNQMLDHVEGALAARQRSETKLRQFVADASHELRNPLASIRGYAELTRRERDVLSGDMNHAMNRIESESERMAHLVEDLLLLARLDAGPSILLEPVDLSEIVVNAVSDAQVAGPGHAWSLHLPPDGVSVTAAGDAHRLHQVVVNLLANARTHTPAGTSVVTTLRTEPGTAVIEVTDDGPGVPEAIRATAFERFTRADVARVRQAHGGSSTGLGLAIVSAVVAAHGGTVSLDSRPGRTTFTVRLPLLG